jgi:Flp pilus assembly protein TadG
VNCEARSTRGTAIRRSPRRLARNRSGASAVEFALVAPILLLLAVGMAQFGIVLNQYIMLTEAVRDGARLLAIARGSSTPYSSTVNQVKSSAGSLTTSSLTITTTVNGSACATDSACSTALSSASGKAASVAATYPCRLQVMGINFISSCTLSSSTTEMIE